MSTELTREQRSQKVWLITGCSTGFGRDLAIHAIDLGYKVAVTARVPAKIEDIVQGHNDQAIALQLDVTKKNEVEAAVDATLKKFGRIDVLVNNAGGCNLFYAGEEMGEQRFRDLMEVNYFGLISVTNTVLPILRKQRSGHIVNISSIGGVFGFSGVAAYNAAKFAVVGFSDALRKEVGPLGIRLTVICPGAFRTKFGTGADPTNLPIEIEDYKPIIGPLRQMIEKINGNQAGSSRRAAVVIVKSVEDEKSPFRVFIGKDSIEGAKAVGKALIDEATAYEQWGIWADHPTDDI